MRRRVRSTGLDRAVDRIRPVLSERLRLLRRQLGGALLWSGLVVLDRVRWSRTDRPRLGRRRLGGALALSGLMVLAIPAGHRAVGYLAQSQALSEPAQAPGDSAPSEGQLLGRIAIPRVALDLAVFEGTSDAVLRKGPGHMRGSEWPGRSSSRGNCVIAGHRDSFFRKLRNVRLGDSVILTDRGGSSRAYRLVASRVVHPESVDAAAPTSDERLTLVSCYPFTWTGPAPYRIVWTARPVAKHPAKHDASARRAGG